MTRIIEPVELNKPDFFVNGLTGSGKDTVSNYLREYFDYRKMRIARTIKTIICEKNDLTFDELEELKRTDPAFRMKHHEESDYLTKEASLVRTKQLAKRTSMDYECVSNAEKQIVICDCRCADEAGILFENDFIGIFLSRVTSEFRHTTHFTEQNVFTNGQLLGLLEEYAETNKFIIALNANDDNDLLFVEQLNNRNWHQEIYDNIKIITFDTGVNPTGEDLLEKIDEVITELIDEENE